MLCSGAQQHWAFCYIFYSNSSVCCGKQPQWQFGIRTVENAFISLGQPHCIPSVWLLVPRSEHRVTKAGRDLQDPSVQASAQQGHGHPKSLSPWPQPDPSWTLPEMVTAPLPGSLPSGSSQDILGWIIVPSSSEWHSQGSKPQPWLCQHHLSSSLGLSFPSGGKQLRSAKCWARAALGLLLLLSVSLFVTCPWELLCILCWSSTAALHSVFVH